MGGIHYGVIALRLDTGSDKETDAESVYAISGNFKTDETLTLRALDKANVREFFT